ncbi:MAG: hypothetical protein J7J31_00040 [Helicobacteraceae bacterium]|nr:hypothetical protein [Helicobacteraceae bacterium]
MSEEMEKEQGDKVVKMNRDKELVIDIDSVEKLLLAINHSTKRLESADAIMNAEGLEKAVGRLNHNIKMLILDEFPKFKKEQAQQFEKMPNEALLKNLSFEISKISSFDKAIGKIKGKHIAITAVLTAVITMVGMSYTKVDDMLIYEYIKKDIYKKNWILDRGVYELQTNEKNRVVFTKLNK